MSAEGVAADPMTAPTQAELDGRLFRATMHLEIDRCRELVAQGANVNAKGQNGWAPLHSATKTLLPKTCLTLIELGAHVDATTVNGWTALHRSVIEGSEPVFELLLANGANVQAKANTWDTPLHMACRHGRTAMCLTLLDAGADPHQPNDIHVSSIDMAIEKDHHDVVHAISAWQARQQARRALVDIGMAP